MTDDWLLDEPDSLELVLDVDPKLEQLDETEELLVLELLDRLLELEEDIRQGSGGQEITQERRGRGRLQLRQRNTSSLHRAAAVLDLKLQQVIGFVNVDIDFTVAEIDIGNCCGSYSYDRRIGRMKFCTWRSNADSNLAISNQENVTELGHVEIGLSCSAYIMLNCKSIFDRTSRKSSIEQCPIVCG